jgi:hypothetical protein
MLRLARLVPVLALLVALGPSLALAQTRAGVVTNLEGTATAARVAQPQPVALKFKDDVFQNDRIVTGDRSVARLLLGGKAVVTIRERSALTITEVPGKSTIDLNDGKIAVAVAKDKMRPGEQIEVKTPNAVAAVRGTTFVVEVERATAQLGGGSGGVTTHVFGFTGQVDVNFGGTIINLLGGNFASGIGNQPPRFGAMTQQMQQQATNGLHVNGQNLGGGQNGARDNAMGVTVATFQGGGLQLGDGNQGGGLGNPNVNQGGGSIEQPQILPGGRQNLTSIVSNPVFSSGPKAFETNFGPPVPGTNFETPIATCDDCVTNVNFGFSFPFVGHSYSSGELSTNGSISLGGSNGRSYTPAVSGSVCEGCDPTFLGGFPRIAVAWADHDFYNTDNNGALRFNTFPGRAVFTWDAASEFYAMGRNTFQLQLRSDGSIVFAYVNLDFTNSYHNILTGVTPGNGASDPGSVNFASHVPFSTSNSTVYQFFSPASTFNLNGVALIFVPNSSGGWDVSDPGLQVLYDGALSGNGPLYNFKGLSLAFGSYLYRATDGAQGSLSDSLLRLVDTSLAVPALLRIDNGGQLMAGGSNPFVSVSGGRLDVGSDGVGHMFELVGRSDHTQVDGDTGLTLGTDQPLQPGAESPVFEATNRALVTVAGSAYRVDTALLEATAPLLNITGGASLTTGAHAVDLVGRAKVAIPNDAVALVNVNGGALSVTNGHLVNVAGGSSLNVAGSLLSLTGGSTVNILNGLLLNITGGSNVSIGKSLVSFSGTGNLLNVTNSFAPTALIGGVPVYGPADSFRISGNALAGLGTAGTIKINGVALTPTTPLSSLSGSLVAVQGNGTVRIGN